MTALSALFAKAVAAAAALTGKQFALMVASSVVATSGILAAGLTTTSSDLGPIAGLLGRDLASSQAPAVSEAAEEPEEELETASGPPPPASGGEASSSGSLPAPAPTEEEAPAPEPEEEATTPEEPPVEPGPIQHVFVVNLASPGYEAAFGATPTMPYLATTLRPQGSLLSNYSLLDSAASANTIAQISGQKPNAATKADCPTNDNFPASASADKAGFVSGDGCVYPVATLSLGDQMTSATVKWRAYMESMVDPTTGAPANCVYPEPGAAEVPVLGGYAVRLNPYTRFHSLLDLGDCQANDVPLTEFDKDLKKTESTPNFSYISPNLCNAGVAGQCPAGTPQGAAAADAFLATLVPKILKSPAYKKDGLLIVTFNQVSPPDPALPAPAPNPEPLKTGTLLISRFASPGGVDAAAYNPYSMLRAVEEIFQLDLLAGAAPKSVKTFAPALLGLNGGD
ncbi:MAG TPA: alkaline phosphatase family protein [Solirubrobacterales bacterium]|nr:alkaline phosphatase family protein [Solirubrobacterales bacterium]